MGIDYPTRTCAKHCLEREGAAGSTDPLTEPSGSSRDEFAWAVTAPLAGAGTCGG